MIDLAQMYVTCDVKSGQNLTLKDIVITLEMLKNVVDEFSFIS